MSKCDGQCGNSGSGSNTVVAATRSWQLFCRTNLPTFIKLNICPAVADSVRVCRDCTDCTVCSSPLARVLNCFNFFCCFCLSISPFSSPSLSLCGSHNRRITSHSHAEQNCRCCMSLIAGHATMMADPCNLEISCTRRNRGRHS